MPNRFQKWADLTGRAYGFIVTFTGNWVTLRKDGKEFECMSVDEVRRVCGEHGK